MSGLDWKWSEFVSVLVKSVPNSDEITRFCVTRLCTNLEVTFSTPDFNDYLYMPIVLVDFQIVALNLNTSS